MENVGLAFQEARQHTVRSLAQAGDLSRFSAVLFGDAASWNLYGTSYGTRVALVTMQAYPEKLPDRVYFTTVTLAAICFTGLLISWRLFAF